MLRLSRSLDHLPCFRCSVCETFLKSIGVKLAARDRPPDIVITDGVRQAIAIPNI